MVARSVARHVEHVCAKKRVIVALITPLYSKRTRSVVREHILSFDYPLLHHSLGARLGIRSQALAEAGRRRRRRRRRRKVYSRRCRASLFLHYQGVASVDASLSRAHSTLALSYTVAHVTSSDMLSDTVAHVTSSDMLCAHERTVLLLCLTL